MNMIAVESITSEPMFWLVILAVFAVVAFFLIMGDRDRKHNETKKQFEEFLRLQRDKGDDTAK